MTKQLIAHQEHFVLLQSLKKHDVLLLNHLQSIRKFPKKIGEIEWHTIQKNNLGLKVIITLTLNKTVQNYIKNITAHQIDYYSQNANINQHHNEISKIP